MKKLSLLCSISLLSMLGYSQFGLPWKNKKAAVVLTYDDALQVHLDHALPQLDSLGLKATFYLTAFADACKNRMSEWKAVAANKHELGNHTLFHPCIGNRRGREWVSRENDLSAYSIQRMENELRMTNVFLQSLDGKKERTFAYTCGDMKIGDSSFINGLKNDFVAARATRNQMHKINEIDLYNVDCYVVNGESGEQMIEWVNQAIQTNSLLVILFHGVGGGHDLNVSLQAHRQLLHYIKQHENELYIAPMVEVANHIKDWQLRSRQYSETQAATWIDYQDMLKQLGIASIRQGADGFDPKAPNAANYDEAKANPYPVLPDALTLKNGRKVTNAKTWWNKRRSEIAEDFDREVYGRTPKNLPGVKWQLVNERTDEVAGISYTTKILNGMVDNTIYPAIEVVIRLQFTYRNDITRPVPVMLNFGYAMPDIEKFTSQLTDTIPDALQMVLQKGWIYATVIPASYQADHGAGLTAGIIGLMNKGQRRKPDDWGALKAWAWGASRVLDYFEKDPIADGRKVAIQGHSRYGKAALVTMAYDPRFAAGFISSSGHGGAKLHRRNAGEIVENVASSGEYHWMAGNYIKYAGPLTWDDLPVDAHELIAMAAPRPLFISSGNVGDGWVDARGMFMATVAASPVYELLGAKGLASNNFPKVEKGILEGHLAFRQHNGGHTPLPNWPFFIDFASRFYNKN